VDKWIAIEPDLTPIKEYLSDKGYKVENINFSEMPASDAKKFDAFVVTGLNKDFMGMSDTSTKAVVIDVKGMTPEQVYHELDLRL
jgi:hypothetical protein